jgi:hypothetical protein
MIDRASRYILLPLALSLLFSCGKDDGDGGEDGTGSGSDSADGTSGQTTGDGGTGTGTDGGGDDGTDGTSGDDGQTDGTSGDDGGTDTDTGDPEGAVVLQNDSWTSFDALNWQGWPASNDCIASVYEIDNQHYPFDIYSVRVIIGDNSMEPATETFRVGIWEVNNQNEPTTEIDGAELEIEGNAAQIPEIKLEANGIVVPTINDGTFAAVVCHVDHMGAPSFATDYDGDVSADHNFVWQDISGEWVQAPDFGGISGDFILRAVIIPQP